MNLPVGTVTRFLQLDFNEMSEGDIKKAVEALCERLFRPSASQQDAKSPKSTYQKMLAFADLFCGKRCDEQIVADVMTKILIELYPAGRIKAQNSLQLEAYMRTAIKRRLVDLWRIGSRFSTLDEVRTANGDTDAAFKAFCDHVEDHEAEIKHQKQLVDLARKLYDSYGAQTAEDRREIEQSLALSTAGFYRRKTELHLAYIDFMDPSLPSDTE